MSFLKKIFSKNKTYHKDGDILKNKITTKEQRLEAIDVLKSLPAKQSIPELLKRFELVIESGLQDTKEKEMCLEAILKHKEEAKPFVSDYLKNQKRLAWVIRIAEKIFSKDEYLEQLLTNLHYNILEFDDDSIERNLDILHALKDIQNSVILDKVEQFLESRDDDTKLIALECIETQAVQDLRARNLILSLAENTTTDINSRFMGAVTHIIEKNQW